MLGACLTIAACAGSVAHAIPVPSRKPVPSPTQMLLATLRQAVAQAAAGERDQAAVGFASAVGNSAFGSLALELRCEAFFQAGINEAARQARTTALGYFRRAVDCAPDNGEAAWQLLGTAFFLGERGIAVQAATHVAEHWPARMQTEADPRSVLMVIRWSTDVDDGDAFLRLALALNKAGWADPTEGPPDIYWRDLALELLRRGRTAEAMQSVSQLEVTDVIVSIRADRRFDELVALRPELFDPDVALLRRADRLRVLASQIPRRLHVVETLAYVLLQAGQAQEAEAICRHAMTRAQAASGEAAYDDLADDLPWIYDAIARAQVELEEPLEALRNEAMAVAIANDPDTRADLLQNFAQMYLDQDRPLDALALLDSEGNLSTGPSGSVRQQSIHARAMRMTGHEDEAAARVANLMEKPFDPYFAALDALLDLADDDTVAAAVIQGLNDRGTRAGTLLRLQRFRVVGQWRSRTHREQRLRAAIGRADVRSALEPVGRSLGWGFPASPD